MAHDSVSLAVLKSLSSRLTTAQRLGTEPDRKTRKFLFRAIWNRNLVQNLCALSVLTVLILLCSCNSNLFGRESKEIAGGYCLKPAGNSKQFVLTMPNESGGRIIHEIGWRKPLIVARASGSQFWDVIDTAHAQHIRLSDRQLKTDPVYQSIQIKPAETAWKDLNRHKRLW